MLPRVKRSFKYHFDRRTVMLTALTLTLFAVGAVLLYVLYMGGFFSAWFVSFVLAVSALGVLSIPRRIVLVDHKLEIQCVFDITEIDVLEIARIRKVSRRRLKRCWLLFGSSGFFGYFGKFLDIRSFDMITIYASEWNNFVEITDIYDARTYVSCRDADELVASVLQARREAAEEYFDVGAKMAIYDESNSDTEEDLDGSNTEEGSFERPNDSQNA